MGKLLIIKGADFRENRIVSVLAAPVITNNETLVTITAQSNTRIFYTTDGTVPTSLSTLYTTPFNAASDTTIKAIAERDGEYSQVSTHVVIPIDGTFYDYIYFDGESYINTLIVPKTNTKVETDIFIISNHQGSPTSAPIHTLGSRSSQGSSDGFAHTTSSPASPNGTDSWLIGNGYTSGASLTLSQKRSIILQANTCYANGVAQNISKELSDGQYPIFLGGMNSGGTLNANFALVGRIYETKIYEGTTLIADLKPCQLNSNNKIGFYDIIGNQFFENSGTGTLDVGND